MLVYHVIFVFLGCCEVVGEVAFFIGLVEVSIEITSAYGFSSGDERNNHVMAFC